LVGETEVLRENSPLVPLRPPQIPLWPDLVSIRGRRCGKPVTKRLSYDIA
jgi:hypothetical protein